jgi:hypothetical protein
MVLFALVEQGSQGKGVGTTAGSSLDFVVPTMV